MLRKYLSSLKHDQTSLHGSEIFKSFIFSLLNTQYNLRSLSIYVWAVHTAFIRDKNHDTY